MNKDIDIINSSNYGNLMEAAGAVQVDWSACIPVSLLSTLEPYAESLGVTLDFVLLPFLSASAGMSQFASVLVKEGGTWFEPCVIWSIALGLSGCNKSGAGNTIAQALEKTQLLIDELNLSKDASSDTKRYPIYEQNIQVTPSKLHSMMADNAGKLLIGFNEIDMFLDQMMGDVATILLSMYNSSKINKATCYRGKETIPESRLNVYGEY